MSDLIERQAAIDAINDLLDYSNAFIDSYDKYAYGRGLLLSAERNIKALPSAQAESDNETEFWRNRAKEYEKMVGELVADMSRCVKFESVEFNENGVVFKKQPERMTNKEWIDLLSKQFNVSRTSARDMLHALMTIKGYDNFKRGFDPLPRKDQEVEE